MLTYNRFLHLDRFLVIFLQFLHLLQKDNELLDIFEDVNRMGQTIVMVTHSVKAASRAGRVMFIRDGEVFHQIYRGNSTNEELYQKISDTLTLLANRKTVAPVG